MNVAKQPHRNKSQPTVPTLFGAQIGSQPRLLSNKLKYVPNSNNRLRRNPVFFCKMPCSTKTLIRRLTVEWFTSNRSATCWALITGRLYKAVSKRSPSAARLPIFGMRLASMSDLSARIRPNVSMASYAVSFTPTRKKRTHWFRSF